jgi:hypothetical protein
MSDWSKLRLLDPTTRRFLAMSLIATPVVACSLRVVGFGRTKAWMATWPRPRRRRAPVTDPRAHACAVARAVGIAAGRGPVRTSCLRRSLLAWWLLEREGVPVAIRIGVRPGHGDLVAHAWIEHLGLPVGEDPEVLGTYAAFDADLAVVAPEQIR